MSVLTTVAKDRIGLIVKLGFDEQHCARLAERKLTELSVVSISLLVISKTKMFLSPRFLLFLFIFAAEVPLVRAQQDVPKLPETVVEADPITPNATQATPEPLGTSDQSAAAGQAPVVDTFAESIDLQGPSFGPTPSSTNPNPTAGRSPSQGVPAANASGPFGTGSAIGRGENLLGETNSASSGRIGQAQLDFRPLNRPGDVLETIPGLIATQHSGTGKANQYFVRGINLDHGTDFAIRIDGVPMNLPSHGHGQGYLDINFLIPELVESIDYRLGPYSADIGDFSSAGSADFHQFQELPNGIATATAGSFDYYRTLIADSFELGAGSLLYAFETTFYDGPWDVPEDFEKVNAQLRWSVGDRYEGFSLSSFAYDSNWTATNQVSQRAVDAGLVGRFGSLDPTDGGDTTRIGLNAQYWAKDDDVTTKANAYVSYYDLDLFSNFTYFLVDPVNGDQIEQIDNRYYAGFNASQTYHRESADHTFGFQFRNDNIYNLGLNQTNQRQLVSQVRSDSVDQQDYALYYTNDARLTDWARSSIGLRGDLFRFHTRSELNPADTNSNEAGIFSPKVGFIFGPWSQTETYFNWGQSFHSNDARGINSSVDPADPLVKSEGSEVGLRSWLTPTWNSTLALWYLEIDSELVFVGDAGTTEAGAASHRGGITWTNYYQVTDWLNLDADYSHVRPRFDGGDRIPNAIENVLSTGFTVQPQYSPWYGTFRVRHYGPAALIEDNSARSDTTTVANIQLGRQTRRTTVAVDVFNVFDSKDNDITYFYESQPFGLPAAEDFHFHPVEPAMARATVAWRY